jgi:hypothetical protein
LQEAGAQVSAAEIFRIGGRSTTTQERATIKLKMSYEHWNVTTATISTCDWEDSPSQTPSSLFVGYYTVVFTYTVDGSHYWGKFHSSHAWEKETEVGVLYNPMNPIESSVCDEVESQIVPVLECVLVLLEGLLP